MFRLWYRHRCLSLKLRTKGRVPTALALLFAPRAQFFNEIEERSDAMPRRALKRFQRLCANCACCLPCYSQHPSFSTIITSHTKVFKRAFPGFWELSLNLKWIFWLAVYLQAALCRKISKTTRPGVRSPVHRSSSKFTREGHHRWPRAVLMCATAFRLGCRTVLPAVVTPYCFCRSFSCRTYYSRHYSCRPYYCRPNSCRN